GGYILLITAELSLLRVPFSLSIADYIPVGNVAEQAIRFIVIDRLVTQGTRSKRGREANERLWTVIGTCALQGRSAYNFILQAVHAYFHDEPAPSLLPGFT
ncbi:MAG: hypothetical protein ABW166_20040, partial [Sedimenticola sp.]